MLAPKLRPSSPLDPLRLLPIFQLIIHSPMQHNIIAPFTEGINHRGLVRARGDFFPHAVAHFDDACGIVLRQQDRMDLCFNGDRVLTVPTAGFFGSHDQFRIAGEVVCVLLVGGRGVGDGVEALEERGDAGFEGAV
jgi:hypothetical protein